MVCRLLIYHVKPMLICHLIATMRGSYNTGAAANLNSIGEGVGGCLVRCITGLGLGVLGGLIGVG